MELTNSLYDLTIIKQGAEGRLFKGTYLKRPVIVKERFKKEYRHPDLDESLTRERIKAEARAIARCKEAGVLTPALYLVDLKRRCIFMEEIENSKTAKEYINEEGTEIDQLAKEIGKSVGRMHQNNIIHGDLTTSNVLIDSDGRVYVIDFGLSQFSTSAEDKAVDLYVLERALVSTHRESDSLFETILRHYQTVCSKSKDVLNKLEEVRARGRKRTMVG